MNISKLFVLALLLSVQYCSARVVFGILDSSNTLIKFDHLSTTNLISSLAITGVPTSEKIVGIDIRPANGKVYLVTTASKLYTLNTITGVATAGASLLNGCNLDTTSVWSVDFNPVADRLRIISSTGANYRAVPDTGDCTVDSPITGTPTPSIVQVAYTNNTRASTATVLYAIDLSANALGIIGPNPNLGNYTQVGALGVTISDQVGFDIVGSNAWASLTIDGTSRLYVIDLNTGAATAVGVIGNGAPVRAIAISFTDYDTTFFGLDNNGHLFRVESEDFSSVVVTPITGLTSEFLLGVDFRPLNNVLYGVSNSSRVYAINPLTSVATVIGNPLNCSFSGAYFGVDWNPNVDLLRVITDSGANYRINVNTSVCFVDSSITSTTSLVTPLISSVAYTNNFVGGPATTLYAIDYSGDSIGTITTANAGVFVFVANLSQATGPATGFDIFGQNNNAIAAIEQGGVPYIVSIDVTTGLVTFIASPGNVLVRSLSASFSRLPYSLSGFYPEILILTASQNLIRFFSNDTSNVVTSTAVTGVNAGTTLLGMSLRPATDEVYAVGSDGRVYVLYSVTAAAYWVSTLNCTLSSSSSYSFDFNPVADLLRVVSRSGENYRVNVTSGVCLVDGNMNYAAGGTPDSVGVAYTNSFRGATNTTEYILDQANDNLARVTQPNLGTSVAVGPTGIDITGLSPLDILTNGAQQQAYTIVNGRLYDIDLTNGKARLYGGVANTAVIGLTALPQNYVAPQPPATTTTTTTTTTATTATTATAATTSVSTTTTTSGAASLAVSAMLLVASLALFI